MSDDKPVPVPVPDDALEAAACPPLSAFDLERFRLPADQIYAVRTTSSPARRVVHFNYDEAANRMTVVWLYSDEKRRAGRDTRRPVREVYTVRDGKMVLDSRVYGEVVPAQPERYTFPDLAREYREEHPDTYEAC